MAAANASFTLTWLGRVVREKLISTGHARSAAIFTLVTSTMALGSLILGVGHSGKMVLLWNLGAGVGHTMEALQRRAEANDG